MDYSNYKCKAPTSFIMEHVLINDFTVKPPYRDYLSTYFILSWSANYAKNQVTEGIMMKDGITYRVVYHRRVGQTHNSNNQWLLSFRVADRALYPNLVPTVLITPKGI